ncbi:MAG: glycosyltransferase [Nanoarchaeota archaeon]|nr:glycosyltransferase [Nanoarchaeota archaeon]
MNNCSINVLRISPPAIALQDTMKYGGIERVVMSLTSSQEKQGIANYVAAPGDSNISTGTLVPTIEKALWQESPKGGVMKTQITPQDMKKHYQAVADFVVSNPEKIDIIHDHPGVEDSFLDRHSDIIHKYRIPILVTLHNGNPEDKPQMRQRYARLEQLRKKVGEDLVKFNAISNSQREKFQGVIDMAQEDVVYHGLNPSKFTPKYDKDNVLFSIGRICPDKGQHIASRVADNLETKLILAGDVQDGFEGYFENYIQPFVNKGVVDFVGSLNDEQKAVEYARSKALLMPIGWDEPFGLVVIEALGSATPVVAFNRGSMGEIIEHGRSGYLVAPTGSDEEKIKNMTHYTSLVDRLNPQDALRSFEERFTGDIEAKKYVKMYQEMISNSRNRRLVA